MVTEKMINDVARRIYEDRHASMVNVWSWDDSGLDDEHPNARAEYEGYARSAIAALSTDAEPVAWLVKRSNFDGVLFDTELSFVRPTVSRTCKTEMVPLYAAPPAPSVAVKALEWVDRHDKPLRKNDLLAEGVVGQYAIRPSSDGVRFRLWTPGMRHDDAAPHSTVESAKAAAQADYEVRVRSALSAQVQDVATVTPSIDTMRDAAKDLILKSGWQPNDRLSPHSVSGLMAEFGMRVHGGEIGCGYPDCGCCADAACEDAIKQHPDFAAPAAKQQGKP